MIIHNVLQGVEEWLALRAGRFTATEAAELKTAGKGLETCALIKAAYRLTGNVPDTYISPAMEWGKAWEGKAREAYAEYIGQEVQTVGFCELDEYAGCSPDGLIGKDGLCEIKCKQDKNHLFTVLSGKVDAGHYGQMQYQMLVTGRKWCDYVCYNPFFKNPLYVKRVLKDTDYQAQLAEGLSKGRELVQQYIKQYEEKYL